MEASVGELPPGLPITVMYWKTNPDPHTPMLRPTLVMVRSHEDKPELIAYDGLADRGYGKNVWEALENYFRSLVYCRKMVMEGKIEDPQERKEIIERFLPIPYAQSQS